MKNDYVPVCLVYTESRTIMYLFVWYMSVGSGRKIVRKLMDMYNITNQASVLEMMYVCLPNDCKPY